MPYDSTRLIDDAPAERFATVTELEHLSPSVVRLTLTLEDDPLTGSAAEFEVGQYMQIEVPGTDALRAYSMSNVSNWDGTLEFLIHLREGGLFSTYLDQRAAPGDRLRLLGPQGTFGLQENGMRPRWFVGGGCGLAPLSSMLRRMAEWGDPQPARLILGVNEVGDAFAADLLDELRETLPELTTTVAVWHADTDLPADGERQEYVKGSSVDATTAHLTRLPDLAGDDVPDVYVCGPPGMVTALEAALTDLGLPEERVHAERITQT